MTQYANSEEIVVSIPQWNRVAINSGMVHTKTYVDVCTQSIIKPSTRDPNTLATFMDKIIASTTESPVQNSAVLIKNLNEWKEKTKCHNRAASLVDVKEARAKEPPADRLGLRVG